MAIQYTYIRIFEATELSELLPPRNKQCSANCLFEPHGPVIAVFKNPAVSDHCLALVCGMWRYVRSTSEYNAPISGLRIFSLLLDVGVSP